jgi:hypothetical protein
MQSMMGAASPMPSMDPMAMMAPGAGAPMGNPFPSTDPAVVAQIVSLIGGMQQQDHMQLQAQQDGVLQMLLSSIMPPAPAPMMDAGFAEGGEAMLAGPDPMMM